MILWENLTRQELIEMCQHLEKERDELRAAMLKACDEIHDSYSASYGPGEATLRDALQKPEGE